jgi:glycosyltransferase involved in cell wall biosynthesis
MRQSWTLDGKVSIVIPCFNHGGMLRETLESVERARNANLAEVIIVDDGSTDPDTCAYFEELAYSPYKIISQPNRGLGPARNAGIEAAQGEFILPLDSDNCIRKCYLSSGVKLLLEQPNVGVVYGDAEYFGERSGRWHVADFDLRQMVESNYIDACALYRKSVWASVNGYDEKMPWMGSEDWDFWMRIAIRGWRFEHLDEIAFDYRVRRGSMVEGTRLHGFEIRRYVFEKPENRVLNLLFEQANEAARLTERICQIEASRDYRFGRLLVDPIRRIKWLLIRWFELNPLNGFLRHSERIEPRLAR